MRVYDLILCYQFRFPQLYDFERDVFCLMEEGILWGVRDIERDIIITKYILTYLAWRDDQFNGIESVIDSKTVDVCDKNIPTPTKSLLSSQKRKIKNLIIQLDYILKSKVVKLWDRNNYICKLDELEQNVLLLAEGDDAIRLFDQIVRKINILI